MKAVTDFGSTDERHVLDGLERAVEAVQVGDFDALGHGGFPQRSHAGTGEVGDEPGGEVEQHHEEDQA